jgi:dolichol kinase
MSSSALPSGWLVEEPLTIPSTLSTPVSISTNPLPSADTARIALEALAKSRRSMLSLASIMTVVVLLQLLFSRWAEAVHARKKLEDWEGANPNGSAVGGEKWWLPRSEWKRTGSVVSFALAVSASMACLKVALRHFEVPIWTSTSGLHDIHTLPLHQLTRTAFHLLDLTIVDIFIASLFHQSSMYVCVRLARRGFTLGELGIVAQFSTALFMESVNLTRAKVSLLASSRSRGCRSLLTKHGIFFEQNSISFLSFLSTSYVQTYRLPTPLLIFQLALIPGSFLTGILLSPLLVLSRHISQKPSHRLRFPEEKLLHRRYLALSFYTGTIVIVGGAVGMWTKWQLGWRDPWMWAIWWMAEGSRWWSRLGLLGYWGTLAAISVGGWELQLAKARKGRAWISVGSNRNVIAVSPSPALTPVTGKNEIPASTTTSSLGVESARPASSTVTARSFASTTASLTNGTTAGVEASSSTSRAGRMMGKVPILSLNGRRKFFHGLAVLMFIPGIYIDVGPLLAPIFLSLSPFSFRPNRRSDHSRFLVMCLQPGFTHLAFSFAFALFIFAEYVRYFALYPFGAIVHLFLNEFLDHKDSGTAILSHFYLLTGCALGVWLERYAIRLFQLVRFRLATDDRCLLLVFPIVPLRSYRTSAC